MKKRDDEGLSRALARVGSMRRFAEKLGITPQALSQWTRVPINRVIEVERITGVSRSELRPDFFSGDAA